MKGHEKVQENGVRNCVHFCLRPLGAFGKMCFCLLTGLIPEHISLKSLKFYNPTSNEDLLENYFCSKKSKYVQKCPMLNMCLVDDAKNYPRKKIWAGGSLTFVVPLLQKAILFRAYPSSSTIHANVLKAVMTNFLGSFFSQGAHYSLEHHKDTEYNDLFLS